MEKINAVIIGLGLVGKSHVDALKRIGGVEFYGILEPDDELAESVAKEHFVKRFSSLDEVLSDPNVHAVHNCTPNHLHYEYNQKIINAKKHIFSEKPLAMNSEEADEMLKLLAKDPKIVHGINHVYRMNPLVQDMKNRVQAGEIGNIRLIHGTYLQDWALYETDYNWRMDPEYSGVSRCIADIGTHWMDMAQTISGLKIIKVCADLVTVYPTRKKPLESGRSAFKLTTGEVEYEEKEVTTEDYGAVLFVMENGVHGVFHCSQISAGRKCRFDIEINGSKASYYWDQENADLMWVGNRNEHNSAVFRNPNLISSECAEYTYMAAGHPEGWNDAMRNNLFAFYKFIREDKRMDRDKADFATFFEGSYLMRLIEAIVESNEKKAWVNVRQG